MKGWQILLGLVASALLVFGVLRQCTHKEKKININLLPPVLDIKVCQIKDNVNFFLICSTTGKNPKASFYTSEDFNNKKKDFYLIDKYEYSKIQSYTKQVESLK